MDFGAAVTRSTRRRVPLLPNPTRPKVGLDRRLVALNLVTTSRERPLTRLMTTKKPTPDIAILREHAKGLHTAIRLDCRACRLRLRKPDPRMARPGTAPHSLPRNAR